MKRKALGSPTKASAASGHTPARPSERKAHRTAASGTPHGAAAEEAAAGAGESPLAGSAGVCSFPSTRCPLQATN